jgi:short-subunit dehydrogenase involved in D-alanine esterification of teichoic acids
LHPNPHTPTCSPNSILVNCAGRFLDEEFHLTAEGLEQTLALDYYAHVLLTLKLLDTLSTNGPSRVVNVSR